MRTLLRSVFFRVFMLVFCVMTAAAAVAADIPLDRNGMPQWVVKEWTDVPIRLELADRESLDDLLARVPLAAFDREDMDIVWDTPKSYHLVIDVRATEKEIAALTAAGYVPERVADVERAAREEAERVWAEMAASGISPTRSKTDPYDYYPTHAQIGTILDDIAANYPTLARTFQWGYSVQSRELWGLVVSANVTEDEAEPKVRISATMHGDEPVPMVNALNLAHYLTENYGVAGYEDVTYLMDNYEIHLMPLYNPDGYILDQRSNYNGVDLNRNFDLPAGTHTTQELETTQFQSYGLSNPFVISQNGHTGALVVNYPWDYTYTLAPDDDALIQMSLEYSIHNTPMYNSSTFDQGITNGAAWYITTGCLQDWSYDQTDCIDLTIETYDTKWPSASLLPGLWEDNRESYMHWIKCARYGVNGLVTDVNTGVPLDATVTVVGNDMPVHTDPTHGNYYKLLDTGSYDITFSVDGYIDQTLYGVSTTWGTPTVLDVQMQPVAHGDITGYVYETGGDPIDAQVNVYTYPGGNAVAVVPVAAGAYTVPSLIYGDYRLVYSADGHLSDEQIVTLDDATVAASDMTLGIAEEVVLLASDFETDAAGWTGGWGRDDDGHDGDWSMTDSPDDTYGNYEENACVTEALDMSDLMSGTVSFWCKWDVENMWDGAQFGVSIDGGLTWTALSSSYTDAGTGQGAQESGEPYYDSSQAGWVLVSYDLDDWLGESDVRFRFLLVSDSGVVKDGFYFDDFVVEGIQEYDPGTGVETPLLNTRMTGVHPNPFNPSTKIAYATPRDGHVTLAVYDVTGRRLRTLVDGNVPVGEHTAHWDGRGDDGQRVASGVYFARVVGGDASDSVKLMLVK